MLNITEVKVQKIYFQIVFIEINFQFFLKNEKNLQSIKLNTTLVLD